MALVNGEASYAAARDRAEGVAQAMDEARIPMVGGTSLFGQWGEGWGRDCARLLASAHPDLDGIVAGSDHIARGVIDALREEGRRVPEDVSVVGFDNWDILVRESRPPLTSVDMNLDDLGRSAAQALVDAIDGRPRTGRHVEPVRLVVRES